MKADDQLLKTSKDLASLVHSLLTTNSLISIEQCEADLPIIVDGQTYKVNKRFFDLVTDLPLVQTIDKNEYL